jgi:periplasmic protein TonB
MPSSSFAVSATVHAAVIGLAVFLTARPGDTHQLPPARPPILIYNPPPDPSPPGPATGSGRSNYGRFAPTTDPGPAPQLRLDANGLPPIAASMTGASVSGADTVWELNPSRGRAGGERRTDGVLSAEAVEVAAAAIPGGPTPRYPEALRAAGVEGRVTLEFVVDTAGRVDPHSIRVLESTADAFVASVRDALAGTRYHPALVAGHPVAQRVRQEFAFALTH